MENNPLTPHKQKIIIAAVFIFAFILGSAVTFFSLPKEQPIQEVKETVTSEKLISEEKLPIGIELLQNPIVYQWRGSVEGTVIGKGTKSLTIENKGDKIVLPYKAASYFYGPLKDKKREKITPAQIVIGSYVRGEFFTFPWTGDKNNIAISTLTVEKTP